MSTELGNPVSLHSIKENGDVFRSQTENDRPVTPTDSDRQLQLIRRIDWRFLLPAPELENVAWIGPAEGLLVQSLKSFSRSLCVLDSETSIQECRSNFDVVVAGNPSLEILQQSAQFIHPEGMLYIEHDKHLNNSRNPFKTPLDYATHLERFGFSDIRTFWHRPDFDACRVIVPLENSAVLRHLLISRKPGLRGKFLSLAATVSFQLGLLQRRIRCFSILARRKK